MTPATLTRQESKRRKAARARDRKVEACNLTPAEKRARRDAHAETLNDLYRWLATPEGAAAWLEGLELNGHLTPVNAALAARFAPGEIVATAASWRKWGFRIRKGETSRIAVTGRGFWPVAAFTARQVVGGEDAEDHLVDPEIIGLQPDPGYARAVAGRMAEIAADVGWKAQSVRQLAEELA